MIAHAREPRAEAVLRRLEPPGRPAPGALPPLQRGPLGGASTLPQVPHAGLLRPRLVLGQARGAGGRGWAPRGGCPESGPERTGGGTTPMKLPRLTVRRLMVAVAIRG